MFMGCELEAGPVRVCQNSPASFFTSSKIMFMGCELEAGPVKVRVNRKVPLLF